MSNAINISLRRHKIFNSDLKNISGVEHASSIHPLTSPQRNHHIRTVHAPLIQRSQTHLTTRLSSTKIPSLSCAPKLNSPFSSPPNRYPTEAAAAAAPTCLACLPARPCIGTVMHAGHQDAAAAMHHVVHLTRLGVEAEEEMAPAPSSRRRPRDLVPSFPASSLMLPIRGGSRPLHRLRSVTPACSPGTRPRPPQPVSHLLPLVFLLP
jgi:hypothetical protein